MGWLITFGIAFLLAILPLGVSVKYDEDGAVVKVIAGPVKITLFPRPKKDKTEKKQKIKDPESPKEPEKQADPAKTEQPVKEPSSKAEKKEKPAKKSGGPITDFLPLVQIALDMLGAFRRRLRLNVLELKLIMAADDPCDLAVNYGKTWTAVGNFLPALERWFVIQKRDVEVECDFTASETKVIARLEITMTLGRLLSLAAVYAVRGLKEFIVFRNKRKGGASQ